MPAWKGRQGRADLWLHPEVRARMIRRARENGQTMNDVANEALCLLLGLDPAEYAVPRRPPGRKPDARDGKHAGPRREGQGE